MATVYRWDDTEAPVIDGQIGSAINFLDKILVDGYGSKPAAGWTKAFVSPNGNKAVYRNSTTNGLGLYYQVNDDAAQASVYYAAKVYGFETMSDVDNGAGQYPTGTDYVWLRKSSSNSATARPWLAIADDQTLYLFVWYNLTAVAAQSLAAPFAMGDYLSMIPGDAYHATVGGTWAYNINQGQIFYLNSFQGITTHMYGPRKSDGTTGNIDVICLASSPLAGPPGSIGFSHPWYGQTLVQRVAVGDASPFTLRGYMPGVFSPMHQYPFDNLATDADGRIAVHYLCGGSHALVLIDATNFRDLPS